jgi:hypothetical protein
VLTTDGSGNIVVSTNLGFYPTEPYIITPTGFTVFEDAKVGVVFPSVNSSANIVIRKHPIVLTIVVTNS